MFGVFDFMLLSVCVYVCFFVSCAFLRACELRLIEYSNLCREFRKSYTGTDSLEGLFEGFALCISIEFSQEILHFSDSE